jgi:hypothetical protein
MKLLGDALPFLATLSESAQRRLAASLHADSSTEVLAIPLDSVELHQFRVVAGRVSALVFDMSLASVAAQPFLELMPILVESGERRVDGSEVSTRLYNLLGRHECLDWHRLRHLSLDEAAPWSGCGRKSLVELFSLATFTALVLSVRCATHMPDDIDQRGSRESADDDEAVLADAASVADPHHRGIAGDAHLPSARDLADALLGRLGDRERVVAECRLFNVGKTPTLEVVGQQLGVTRERVRQLERKVEERLGNALASEPELALAGEELAQALGSAVPEADLDRLAPKSCLGPESFDQESLTGQFLLWLAGPFVSRHGWLIRNDVLPELEESVETAYREALANVASLASSELEIELVDLGVRSDLAASCVREWSARHMGAVAVSAPPLAVRLLSVLNRAGRPQSADALLAELGPSTNRRTLMNLVASDDRFVRVRRGEVALSEWGFARITTVAEALQDEIARRGGEAPIEEVVTAVCAQHGHREKTVRMTLGRWEFIRGPRGTVRVRTSSDHVRVEAPPVETTRRCYLSQHGWVLRIPITAEVLRGSSIVMPMGVAGNFGVGPGGELELSTLSGTIRVSWRGAQPHIGSLRSEVLEMGGVVGDQLLVEVGRDDRVNLRLLGLARLQGEPQLAQLALLVGQDPSDDDDGCLAAVAAAVGIDVSSATHDGGVTPRLRAALVGKGDDDLVALLPVPAIRDEAALLDEMLEELASGRRHSDGVRPAGESNG